MDRRWHRLWSGGPGARLATPPSPRPPSPRPGAPNLSSAARAGAGWRASELRPEPRAVRPGPTMGNSAGRSDFEWVYTDQPHTQRRKEMLGERPRGPEGTRLPRSGGRRRTAPPAPRPGAPGGPRRPLRLCPGLASRPRAPEPGPVRCGARPREAPGLREAAAAQGLAPGDRPRAGRRPARDGSSVASWRPPSPPRVERADASKDANAEPGGRLFAKTEIVPKNPAVLPGVLRLSAGAPLSVGVFLWTRDYG